MATPSGVRTFTGYDYASKTGGETVRLYSVGTLYNDGAIASSYIKRLAEVVSDDGDVIKSIWLKDSTYTGTVDYNSADTTGFIKVMETSVMSRVPIIQVWLYLLIALSTLLSLRRLQRMLKRVNVITISLSLSMKIIIFRFV